MAVKHAKKYGTSTKAKSRNRNKFAGAALPHTNVPAFNIHGIALAGIAAHDQNGRFPRKQAMNQQAAQQALPEGFNQAFYSCLPVYHEAVRKQVQTIFPDLDATKLDPMLTILDRMLPNHPEHDTPEGLNTEKLMADLYRTYHEIADPVETDSAEAADAYQADIEKKLGALQFAALREVMTFIQAVQKAIGLGGDAQIEEASEFSGDLDTISDAKIKEVMDEQRPDFSDTVLEQEDEKIARDIAGVLGLAPESLVQHP